MEQHDIKRHDVAHFYDDVLEIDRNDLLTILHMRFGSLDAQTLGMIENAREREVLERWILIAANATSLDAVKDEMEQGARVFSIFGEQFNPLSSLTKGVN